MEFFARRPARMLIACVYALPLWLAFGEPALGFWGLSNIEQAQKLANSGNSKQAFEILVPLAEKGDADAQFALAEIQLRKGWRGRYLQEGVKWLTKASEQGHLKAQLRLGEYYVVDEKNFAEAFRWFRKIAERIEEGEGQAAAFHLALMYANAEGVPRDYVEASRWMQLAAEREYPAAQFQLGLAYLEGIGVPKDFAKAVTWLGKAAEKKYEPARLFLTVLYAEGIGTEKNAIEAATWYAGNRPPDVGTAAYLLGTLYMDGIPIKDETVPTLRLIFRHRAMSSADIASLPRVNSGGRWADAQTALYWYRIGADAGFVGAQVNLATLLWRKDTTYRNCSEALKWMRVAVEQGDPTAMLNLGMAYAQGPERCPGAEDTGLRKDSAEAAKWFEKAANLGNNTGLFYLANAYRKGDGVPRDTGKAVELYKRGADRDDWESAQELAHIYYAGEGDVPRDEQASNTWMRKAIDLKHKAVRRQ